MKKHLALIGILGISCLQTFAQKQADTVIIKVGASSKIIFTIQDKKDLETLKHYNFQSLMEDMITKLEKRDSTQIEKPAGVYLKDTVADKTVSSSEASSVEEWPTEADRARYRANNSKSNYYNYSSTYPSKKNPRKRTYSSFSIDLGTNNYLENGKFPADANAIYTVRPWGSWYVALNSIQRTRVANKFFLEWGGGVSWYNFKFQNDRTLITKDDNGVIFSEDKRDYNFTKSKLTVAYVQFSLVPMIDFGNNYRKPGLFNSHHTRGVRFGIGPYIGYRIDSYTKQKYEHNDDTFKEHHHDPYYLTNIRWGYRFQFGFKGADFFFNYDMNDLFVANKGPQLNAFSFGVSF
jgi:hypothetical protein